MPSTLVQIVDAALALAVERSGAWIACRPGCTECCHGPFEITAQDAILLKRGLAELERQDHTRAAALLERALTTQQHEDDPCPALDPATGTCDLYAWRPLICRTFGPAIRHVEGISTCELCYTGATDQQIEACAVAIDLSQAGPDVTTVALALRSSE